MTRIAIIGTGVIGSSWAALFAAHGHEVSTTDPRPDATDHLRRAVERCWPSLERQRLVVDTGSPDLVTVVGSTAEAVDGAGFVQENAPERIDLKHDLYREIDGIVGADVVIASSSSGLMATELQSACKRHPERVLIGHPFNPPHLVPLVEVVGGEATSDAAIDAAMRLYTSIGKSPIHIRSELPGHVTNRLQAALWREAYWLVEQGVVSVAEVDRAISAGPGLRWALLGPFATQHLSGGEAGLAYVLEHLGPPMVEWWETFRTAEWTPELKATLVAQMDDELAGIDQSRMLDERDRLLEQLVVAKSGADHLPGGSDR
ncbi:MAG: 3-hydroxyacyl-CoA dehydrogenase [Acidimicrobiaceae bacterium]|nr:3-hydroxyacyl-CoA dehydrogenase [Acidimicrobiaceae bacterium]